MTVSKILCLEIIKYAIGSKLGRFPAWVLFGVGWGSWLGWVWQFCEKTTNEILLKIKENGISFRKFISIYINVRGEADCIEKYTCTDRWRNNTTVERKSEKVSLFLFLRSLHEIFLPEKCSYKQRPAFSRRGFVSAWLDSASQAGGYEALWKNSLNDTTIMQSLA